MPAYFDSSVLLSLVVGDAHGARAHELWHAELERVSSVLIEIECRTVLRRVPAASWSESEKRSADERLTLALEEITLKPLDEDVVGVVRATTALAGCRALDAAHIATALYFRAAAEDLWVCTFDGRMGEVAARLGLTVCGSEP